MPCGGRCAGAAQAAPQALQWRGQDRAGPAEGNEALQTGPRRGEQYLCRSSASTARMSMVLKRDFMVPPPPGGTHSATGHCACTAARYGSRPAPILSAPPLPAHAQRHGAGREGGAGWRRRRGPAGGGSVREGEGGAKDGARVSK